MKKILIIEDDSTLRENTAEFLKEEGFDVSSAADGKKGLAKALEILPDLILCDISMPEMDGYEVFRNIQDDASASLIPFIFLTARVEKENFRQGMGMGVDDYITKPFNFDELMNSVNSRIERQAKVVKANEEKYRALTESSLTGVFMVQGNKFEYINDKFSLITGYAKTEMLNMGFHHLIAKNQSQEILEKIENCQNASSNSCILEFRIITKHGEVRHINLFGKNTSIKNKNYFIGNILDTTERKKAYEQVLKAKEEAELANRVKAEFLLNISHEIRTPLNGIMGMSELLKELVKDAEFKEYIDVIVSSGNELLNVINNILEVSAIENGEMELYKKKFKINNCILNLLKIIEQKAITKNLEFKFSLEKSSDETVFGDEIKIKQILNNILGNAIKFTEKGHVALNVTSTEINEKEIMYSFAVEDTGEGIPANMHQAIFDAFRQVDGSSTRRHGGNGLGLTIAKKMIEMMGGEIGLKSEEKKGSSFYFALKFEKDNK